MIVRVFCITLALLFTLSAWAQIAPPLKMVWKKEIQNQLENVAVTRKHVYFGTFHDYGAMDRETGEILFVQPNGEKHFGAHVAFSGDTLYVSIGQRGLLACDPKTGDVRWSVPGKPYGIEPLVADGCVFTTLQEGFMSAVGIKEHKPLWTVDLRRPQRKTPDDSSRMSGPSVLAQLDSNRVLVGTNDAEVFCLNALTGKRLWKTSFKLPAYGVGEISSIVVGPQLLVSNEEGIAALEPDTGRVLWHFTKEEDPFRHLLLGPEGTVFALAGSGTLYGLNATTGELLWSQRLSKAISPDMGPMVLGDSCVLVGIEDSLQAISSKGKALWAWKFLDKFDNSPFFVSGGEVVIAKWRNFYRYIPGLPPGPPADPEARRALARELATRLDKLNSEEIRLLESLGDEAFEVLFSISQKNLYGDALVALALIMQPKHTASILELLKKTDDNKKGGQGSARASIFRILAGEGFGRPFNCPARDRSDPDLFLPYVLRELEEGERNAGFESALNYISRSSHPDALSFLKKSLRNPKASQVLRQTAYENLARTGGAAFVPDILAMRDTNRRIPSLVSVIGIDSLPDTPDKNKESPTSRRMIAVAKDARGHIWGLFRTHILGNYDDLWVVHQEAGHWVEPVFTGKQLKNEKTPKDWLVRFAENPALRVDTDGDGWTDLVEKRLGTNPKRADTDNDGLKDSEDANPLAASPSLSDTEKVLQAAFEARYHFDSGASLVCLVELPEGATPLEFSSWGWIIIPKKENQKVPLQDSIGKGVGSVSFWLPRYDLNGAAALPRKKEVILWNADRTRAKLGISTHFGPIHGDSYDIELQKFGSDWVVVRCEMTLIS